ncbi:hypothetical protein OROGR_030044 [Orobanche gracilis]
MIDRHRTRGARSTVALFLVILIIIALITQWLDISIVTGSLQSKIHLQDSPHIYSQEFDCSINCSQISHVAINIIDPPTNACPEYFRWIQEDLRPWRKTGITKEAVEKAKDVAHVRIVVVNGRLYTEKYKKVFQTRDIMTVWGILQLLRLYPGKLSDFDLMLECGDKPVIRRRDYGSRNASIPPLFHYCGDDFSYDIVLPDWSFWAAETNIKPWRSVLKDIKDGNERTKWEDRVPYAYWKGNPHVSPWRADLMKCNVTAQSDWNTRLYVQDWVAESQKGYKESNIGDQCTHRYKIYIEGWSWSVSEKYILACNSPTLLMTLRWYDFFVRGMIPQHHFWPVRDNDKCRSLKFAVEWGNNHTEKAKAIGEAGSRYIHEDMKMEYVYDYMFHLLNEYAKLLKYEPTVPPNAIELCPESMACPANGIWRKFMEESLEKSPSDSVPCRMPPPYDPQELKTLFAEKVKASKKVEAWENHYWDKQKTRSIDKNRF